MFKKITVSAPGKLILFGEHAVVYGKKAIAASLNLRTELHLESNTEKKIILEMPDLKSNHNWAICDLKNLQDAVEIKYNKMDDLTTFVDESIVKEIKDFVKFPLEYPQSEQMAVVTFLYVLLAIYFKKSLPQISVKISSQLPIGAGLGSSASYSVCISASLLILSGNLDYPHQDLEEKQLELINNWAFLSEKCIHGNPSGIDNSVSTYGKAIICHSRGITKIKEMPKLKILLVNSGVSRNTRTLVNRVNYFYNKYQKIISNILESINKTSDLGVMTLNDLLNHQKNDLDPLDIYNNLYELIDINHNLLVALGVNHISINKIINCFHDNGIHGKITGAGGGGCVYAILPPDFLKSSLEEIKEKLKKQGFICYESYVGEDGVKINIHN